MSRTKRGPLHTTTGSSSSIEGPSRWLAGQSEKIQSRREALCCGSISQVAILHSAAEETRRAHKPASLTTTTDSVTQPDRQAAKFQALFKSRTASFQQHTSRLPAQSVTSNYTDLHSPTITCLILFSSFSQLSRSYFPQQDPEGSRFLSPPYHRRVFPVRKLTLLWITLNLPSASSPAQESIHAANPRALLSVYSLTAHSVSPDFNWICSVSQKAHESPLPHLLRNLSYPWHLWIRRYHPPTSQRFFRSPTVSSNEGRQAF